jgi:7-cyano-7-deazaguanine synthase in queuosine biosynthesis
MRIGPRSADLIEVALGVFFADRLVKRTRGAPRSIQLRLRVRSPRLWQGAANELEELLSTLTGDRFAISFLKGTKKHFVITERRGHQSPFLDRMLLYSGGLDSSSAAAWFATQPEKTGFVTQYSVGIRAVEELLRDIYSEYAGDIRPVHACFFVRPFGPQVRMMRENSRRSRSFLFLSLAVAFAMETGASDIFVCENGPLALNLPLTPAMVPTRHAHGDFLTKMSRLCQTLFNQRVHVGNPFELSTKGQMATIFKRQPELALRTLSCWYQQWSGAGHAYSRGHCGHCLPCVVRRVSLEAAGITIASRHFDLDVFRLISKAHHSARERHVIAPVNLLIEFAKAIKQCPNWRRFVQSFPEALSHVPTCHDVKPIEWYQQLFNMMRRFANEVLAASAAGGRR